jgi:hypothetical protein
VTDPAVRARHLKSVLAAIDGEPRREEIRRRSGEGVTAAIEGSGGSDWLPVAHDVALARALDAVLGPEGLATFNQRMMLQSFEGPLLRTLVQTAMAVIGADPAALARWIPKGWQLMFQGCGSWRVEPSGATSVALTLTEMAPACAEDPVWPRSVASALSAVPVLARVVGSVELVRIDPPARTARYAFTWRG